MLDNLILAIVPSVILAVVSYFLGRANKRADKKEEEKDKVSAEMEALKEGMCAILRIKLIEQHDKWAERGAIPFYALENWSKMFSIYKKLGGNGVVEQMDKEIKALSVNQ